MTTKRQPRDPAVAPIERILSEAALRYPAGPWQGRARHVVYICACCTEGSSPDWVIYGTDDGIGWRRWPDDLHSDEEVDASYRVDGHADPTDVLAWLGGKAEDPWGGVNADSNEEKALAGLRRWLTREGSA